MATDIILPKVGFSMDRGIFQEWLIEDGEHVEAGEPLYLFESDKLTQEVEAPVSGTVRHGKAVAGNEYPVGTVFGSIE